MDGLRRFFALWQNWLALGLVAIFIFLSLAASWLQPQKDPEKPSPYHIYIAPGRVLGSRRPIPPDQDVVLGTLPGGLDVFYTLVWGAYPALRFGLLTAFSTAVFGLWLGALSAYIGGWFNGLILRITDAFLAFPAIAGVFFFRQLMMPVDLNAPPGAFRACCSDLTCTP